MLFPPSERHPEGRPWCAHAHCASLRTEDWIDAIGREAWDDACLAARGMRRAGPWVLFGGGISTWYRGLDGALTPSRRDVLCEVPLWVVEEVRTARRTVRVIDAVVGAKVRRVRVDVRRFASLEWLRRLGVDPDVMPPWRRQRLVEAIERLSEPVPLRAEVGEQPASPERADDLLRLLDVVLRAARERPENESSPRARVSRR